MCRRFGLRVRLYGLKHLRSPEATGDLVQEVLVVLIQTLRAGRLREPERVASFVLGTARRLALDLGRRERRGLVPNEALDFVVAPPEEPAPPFDDVRLKGCLERLSERERSVVVLTFYAERDSAGIGDDLGMAPGNVRVVRHRALTRLHDCMAGPAEAAA